MRGEGSEWRLGTLPHQPEPWWPEVLPPFVDDALFAAPDDMLWVRRTGPADEAPTFDVFGPDGALDGRVVLPAGRELLGVGHDAVYLVQRDEMDLLFVERYRLPRVGG